MRIKEQLQRYFDFSGKSSVKVVREYQEKYGKIAEILEANPRLVALAHQDWSRGLSQSRKGRASDFTSEQMFRVLVVMFVEGDSYRDVVVRIDLSEFLRQFVGLGIRPMMDFSLVSKAHGALSEKTWERINGELKRYAKQEEKISGEKLRLDSTVRETNIHYPTDSSLLWDSFRVVAREVKRIRKERPELRLKHRFHVGKIKRMANQIARWARSTSGATKRRVEKIYRQLIERVAWILEVGQKAVRRAQQAGHGDEVSALEETLPLVKKVVEQATRRIVHGEMPAADEKVYSIFEGHTEMIKRGKAGKPVEFGHKVLLAQSGEKFITHYQVLPKNQEDVELLEAPLQDHEKFFGKPPKVLATDRGFYRSVQQLKELRERIERVCIPKKGQLDRAQARWEHSEAFKEGQCFRAGSEGSISVLKRVFRLGKCLFKGFKNFASSVGCGVFCHNLVLLTHL